MDGENDRDEGEDQGRGERQIGELHLPDFAA